MADEFALFKDIYGWDITVSLDFYTHAVVRNGRVVAPFNDLSEGCAFRIRIGLYFQKKRISERMSVFFLSHN